MPTTAAAWYDFVKQSNMQTAVYEKLQIHEKRDWVDRELQTPGADNEVNGFSHLVSSPANELTPHDGQNPPADSTGADKDGQQYNDVTAPKSTPQFGDKGNLDIQSPTENESPRNARADLQESYQTSVNLMNHPKRIVIDSILVALVGPASEATKLNMLVFLQEQCLDYFDDVKILWCFFNTMKHLLEQKRSGAPLLVC